MTKKYASLDELEQAQFVDELCHNIAQDLVRTILSGKVPDTFDGHELRVWLAKRFEESADMSVIRRFPRSKRAQEFRNWYVTTR